MEDVLEMCNQIGEASLHFIYCKANSLCKQTQKHTLRSWCGLAGYLESHHLIIYNFKNSFSNINKLIFVIYIKYTKNSTTSSLFLPGKNT